jgi:hypothetical protein
MEWPTSRGRGVRKKKKKKAHVVRGENLSVVFLVVLESPACGWWQRQRLRCGGGSGRKLEAKGKQKSRVGGWFFFLANFGP